MAFNDRMVIRDLGHLQTAIRNDDRASCMSLQELYGGFLPEDLAPWHTWEERFQRKDTFASLLMPDDIPANLTPTKVTGDGNCLFNCASINLVGNEDLSVVLRLLTAVELYLHADFYANHSRYNQAVMKMSDAAKFMVSLSVDIQDGRDRIVALKRQAMWTCRNKQWAGLVEMMALSTVIRNDVYSVYPDASPAMRPLFHGLIKPRIARDASRTCYIMWSRCSSFDNEGVFQPNHFVSLSEVHIEEKRAKTYAQIVAGKQKGEGENMGGKKPHTLFFERKTPFSSPTSLDKGKEQGNSADDTNRVQNDPEPTSLDKDQEEADLTANEKKVAEQDSFLPTSSPGKGKEQRNSAEDTKEVEGDSESSTTSLDKDQEENLTANEKKVAEQVSFLPTSSPGKGKEQRNSADDTKEVEGDSKSSTTSLDSDQEEDLTANEKKVAEQDSFSPASSPGKGKEQGNSAEGMKEVEEDSESSTSSVEKGKTYLRGEQDSESGEGSFGEESPVEYQEQEEQGKNGKVGDTRFRKKPSSPSSDPTTASSPPKRSKITPLSPTDVSIKLSLLATPSLRHQKRKFSKVEQSTSTSASLFKHLTVLTSGNPKNPVDEAGTGDKEKREKGKQSVIEIGTSHDATSPASHQGKNTYSALLPLSVSYRWYMDCGNRESKNRSRADWRASNTMLMDEKGMNLATNRSRVIGRLEENIKVLQEKIDRAKTPKEKTRLLAIKAVGEHLVKNPIMPTQDAGQILAQESQQTIDGVTRRRLSMEIYEILGKHLNVVQIYIREKAFLMENRSSPLLDVVSNVKKIFDSFDVRSQINAHIEEKIGDCYKTALAYLDTKRDQDTLKFLLTKITSINFMAKLQGTSNKRSIQTCTLKVPGMLERFQTVMQELKEKEELSDLAPHEKRGFLRRQKDLIKERQLRHRYKSSVSGRKLKIEEFPDIAAILEYEFGEGDRIKRGGGGLESHSKLGNDTLYRAADNKTNMVDARLALLSLAPEDFSISLSCCYNYTQNFRKGTLEAKRHHEGRGINACVSLHKAPDTAPIKDLVVNVHWSSANVNAILDEAAENASETFVDSYDAKQVVRPNDKHNNKTWRRCEYQDHTYDQSRNNAVTPMTHLFLRTEETRRDVKYNSNVRASASDVIFCSNEMEETTIHQKRTGRAITVIRLSLYENETVFRSINEILYLMTLPQLDYYFRDPNTGKLKQSFVFVVDNGVDMPRSPLVKMLLVRLLGYLGLKKICQVSFAEYHSKRNPVERVHATEEKALSRHGPFESPKHDPHTPEHKAEMEAMADEVRIVFGQAKFAGEPILSVRGKDRDNYIFNDEDDLHNFLAMNEQRKLECPLSYKVANNVISQELSLIWGLSESFEGEYAEDYQMLINDTGSSNRTAWQDKYTTTIFNESSLFQRYVLQPIPDYIRWYLSDGEMHYLPYEQRRDFVTGPWDIIPELFLPSRLLELLFLCIPSLPSRVLTTVSLLTWCSTDVIQKFLSKKTGEVEESYNDCIERQRWRQHPLFAEKKEILEAKCKKNGLECSGGKHLLVKRLVSQDPSSQPPVIDEYSGDISSIPCTAREITKLPVSTLKQILHFHNIPTQGSKEQLTLRVMAVRTGTTHLLFSREMSALENVIEAAKLAITEQIKNLAINDKVIYREREFQRKTKATISVKRPRENASISNQERNEDNGAEVPEGTSLSNLPNIFEDLQQLIKITREVKRDKVDPDNIEAIRTPGTKVAVLWKEDDAMSGWEPGWYTAIVRTYSPTVDEISIEYVSEPSKRYTMKVKDSVKEGVLKVLRVTCNSNLYDEVTEIGARIHVKWSGNELKGTGWKSGWYAAEVQGFDPDEDTISIIYDREPKKVYQECVTEAISRGEIRLRKGPK